MVVMAESVPRRYGRWLALCLAVAVIAGACQSSSNTLSSQPLQLKTAAQRSAGCPTAALLPVQMVVNGDVVQFVSSGTEQTVDVEWPPGFHASRINGIAVLQSPSGEVIATEGDELVDLSGGLGAAGTIGICTKGGHQL